MGISIRSLQRYLNGLVHWGLVAKDVETPQGFTLTDHAKQLFAELASGADA
jgi:predicted transcriptional regulator